MKAVVVTLFVAFVWAIPSFAGPVWYPSPPEAYKFGELYPEAQKLLYAFDYGHALVYERLLLNRGKIKDPEAFEKMIMKEIMPILKNPPDTKSDESDIAPVYVHTFPLIVDLFDWSHLLHQYVLDVLAVSKDRGPKMVKRINELFVNYKSFKPIAITDVCKTMLFMDGHDFSKAFRRKFPRFNLLIWSYHWFQIRLYEALLKPTRAERDTAVEETVKAFWALISDLPDSADFDMMPMTADEAPSFAHLFSTIPAAFDNNHMLHDVVSDLLASEKVPDVSLRSEGVRMGRVAMDPLAFKASTCAH